MSGTAVRSADEHRDGEAPSRSRGTNGHELWRDGPLALMNDLDIVAVRIEHPCRVIARIVFGPSLR